jgi:hypothetical protein
MKILVLILASDTENIYLEFQSIWRKYMKSHPDIDCYFYKADPTLTTEYKLEEDTLWIRGNESLSTVYEKTMKAFAYFAAKLDRYDFVFRPNLSSFIVFDKYIRHCTTLPKQRTVSAVVGREGDCTYPSGAAFTMSSDLVLALVRDNPPKTIQDDVTIGKWLYTKGIPILNVSRCDYTDGTGIPRYGQINQEDTFHYRVKNANRQLDIAIHNQLYRRFYWDMIKLI